jgi:tRNA dimethylallyltransferase
MDDNPCALIVAGPTCSGKSALALELAERCGGVVINADAMQTYRELRVLTARPTPAEEARVPHRLYGVRPAREPGSVAWWRGAAVGEMAAARAAGMLPILCGGSGMYLASLSQGIADIPDPGAEARAEARALLAELGPQALHARLAEVDPETAAKLRPGDSQRLARAWEVWRGTGRGIAAWQRAQTETAADGTPDRVPWRFRAVLLDPPRPVLRQAIAARFDAMLASGAIEEVAALLAKKLDPALPAMRAHGVPELSAYLRGEILLGEARTRTVLATGQYTKRQATWFRHHNLADAGAVHMIHARIEGLTQFSERNRAEILNFIEGAG